MISAIPIVAIQTATAAIPVKPNRELLPMEAMLNMARLLADTGCTGSSILILDRSRTNLPSFPTLCQFYLQVQPKKSEYFFGL